MVTQKNIAKNKPLRDYRSGFYVCVIYRTNLSYYISYCCWRPLGLYSISASDLFNIVKYITLADVVLIEPFEGWFFGFSQITVSFSEEIAHQILRVDKDKNNYKW